MQTLLAPHDQHRETTKIKQMHQSDGSPCRWKGLTKHVSRPHPGSSSNVGPSRWTGVSRSWATQSSSRRSTRDLGRKSDFNFLGLIHFSFHFADCVRGRVGTSALTLTVRVRVGIGALTLTRRCWRPNTHLSIAWCAWQANMFALWSVIKTMGGARSASISLPWTRVRVAVERECSASSAPQQQGRRRMTLSPSYLLGRAVALGR
jgi:hypothetical protein